MQRRELGRTGIMVSATGFGTWGIGGPTDDGANSYGQVDDHESLRALHRALELGINFFDTSNIYGYGHSESLLATAFADHRNQVVLASKVGFTRHGGSHDISPDYIRRCLGESLSRLHTDYLDLYQLHSPPLDLVRQTPEAIVTLLELKRQGRIRAIGYSVKHPADGMAALEYPFDVLQVNFNMIDQRAVDCGLLAAAAERGVGVISRTPFAFGFLTDMIRSTEFSPLDHRSTWPASQLRRWQAAPGKFAPVRARIGGSAGDLALRFCLAFPAVSSVIPGMMTVAEVEANAASADLRPLVDSEVAAIREIYRREEFFERRPAAAPSPA